jgi:hypothetical protein
MSCDRSWRRVLAADLGAYNIAIFFFALLPPSTLNSFEWAAMLLAFFNGVGVLAHAMERFNLPGEEWAYLTTGATGLFVLISYVSLSTDSVEVKLPFTLFLISGVLSGYAAHVIDGGHKREHSRR